MPNERRCGTCAKLEYYSDLLEGGLEVVYPECPHRAGVAEDDAACRLYEPLDGPGRGGDDAGGPETRRTCRDLGGYEGTNYEGYDFACSACGYCCDLPQPRYCPWCGARVVGDDE